MPGTGKPRAYWNSVANWPFAGMVLLATVSPLTAMVGVPMPLDPGAMINVVDYVLFISGISPVFGTGGTEIYPPISKDEKAGRRES